MACISSQLEQSECLGCVCFATSRIMTKKIVEDELALGMAEFSSPAALRCDCFHVPGNASALINNTRLPRFHQHFLNRQLA
jgi:hypothetical protein